MRIKRSGRVVIITTLMLLFYTGLVIWYSKPPVLNQAQIERGTQLIQTYPELKGFLERLGLADGASAFYSIGLSGQQVWPTSVRRACYHDPLVARWQFSNTRAAFSNDVELIRYRSRGDFLTLLLNAELATPGYITNLDLRSHTLVLEDPLSISMGSIMIFVAGMLGLVIVSKAQKDR